MTGAGTTKEVQSKINGSTGHVDIVDAQDLYPIVITLCGRLLVAEGYTLCC